MLKRVIKTLHCDERGITGLETAIILIAFVVVAAVFAYSVLSAGIFSSQKGQEAIYSGLSEARATLELKGDVFAFGNTTDGNITAVSVTLTNTMGGQAVDLTPNPTGNETHVTIIGYTDKNQHVSDMPWAVSWIGRHSNDNLRDRDEQAVFRIDLTGLSPRPARYGEFTIEIKPPTGAPLIINRTFPASVDAVMNLH